MKLIFLCLVCSISIFDSVYSAVNLKAVENDGSKLVTFNLNRPFELKCNVTTDEKGKKFDIEWKKDGVPLDDIESIKGRYRTTKDGSVYKLIIRESKEDDVGNYTCLLESEDLQDEIQVIVRPLVKLPSNINVVEEEKLKITCVVHGKPHSELSWFYSNDTLNLTDIQDLMDTNDRISLEDGEQKIPGSVLVIKSIQMWERGEYTCVGTPPYGYKKINDTTMVRIKDKYAALWPFLGICAEVFVLCAIILIYEKKRNKTELDESDTDQSPDQKNTPDHNKDSNLRHRQ